MYTLVIEHFRDSDPKPVYDRLRHQGRQLPEGLRYVSSWVTSDLTRCYQVMQYDDRAALEQWMERWADLVELELVEVLSSQEVQQILSRS